MLNAAIHTSSHCFSINIWRPLLLKQPFARCVSSLESIPLDCLWCSLQGTHITTLPILARIFFNKLDQLFLFLSLALSWIDFEYLVNCILQQSSVNVLFAHYGLSIPQINQNICFFASNNVMTNHYRNSSNILNPLLSLLDIKLTFQLHTYVRI